MKVLTGETKEERQHRIDAQRAHHAARSEKWHRRRGGASEDVELANIFRELGIANFMSLPRSDAFKLVPSRLEGRKALSLTKRALEFLEENFDMKLVRDKDMRQLVHFSKGGKTMNLTKQLVEESGQPRKIVKKVYDALLGQIQKGLKEDRSVRLPGIGKLRIRFKPARAKKKGRNPFTGKDMIFKAKPASNKLRFRPAKELKEFVGKLKVVAPKGKTKKKKKSKSK